MTVFTHIPSTSFGSDSTPRVLRAQFGDGYSQRTVDGINAINKQWNVAFNNRTLEESLAIVTFFIDKAAAEAFEWTPPGDITEVKVVASSWKEVYTSPITRTISAKFELVYEN